jgi:hypothetical protein
MDAVGEKLLQVAIKQLGYSENSSGYTKFGDWYSKNIAGGDSYYTTAPWCDMFLAWAASQAGVVDQTGEFASTIDHAKWFQQHGAWGHTPEPGAIVFFSWDGSLSTDDIAHVGLVESVDGSTLHTIEANTTGGELMRKTRDTSVVVGYGYPAKVQVVQSIQIPYAPRHSAPPPSANAFLSDTSYLQTAARSGHATAEPTTPAPHHESNPLGVSAGGAEAVLSCVMTLLVCGSLALAVGKATAKKVPTPSVPEVRVRKRGKHHRTAQPVELPAEMTEVEFTETAEAAEAGTILMPALTAEAAQLAEDQVFWGKIADFKDDEELSFWNDLHESVAQSDIARDRSVERRPRSRRRSSPSSSDLAEIAESEGVLNEEVLNR